MSRLSGTRGKPEGPQPTVAPWAVCLPSAQIVSAGSLRLVPGIEVCAAGESVWLRGGHGAKDLDRRLRALPGAQRFRVLDDGQLVAAGRRIPQGRIPEGPWVPLVRWLGIETPEACRSAGLAEPIRLELRRSVDVVEPSVLLASMDGWLACANACAQVRLDRWRFAVSRDGRVVVHGHPLPSLPGLRLVDYDGIAVPAGWYWSPAVEPAVVRQRWGLEPGDLALWQTAGTWQRIAAEDFVQATRAAIRASAEGFRRDRS